ncbi:hypothetical protein Y032_0168g200 [Ancylostoma ceylanicum]|nr:hypothetical protein Y032_0168g200 [Ancylostoma ceylanicum]
MRFQNIPECCHATIQFLHDPARQLIIRVTRQKLLYFGWEVLTSPPYRVKHGVRTGVPKYVPPFCYHLVVDASMRFHSLFFESVNSLSHSVIEVLDHHSQNCQLWENVSNTLGHVGDANHGTNERDQIARKLNMCGQS